jgi:hypothetical protein
MSVRSILVEHFKCTDGKVFDKRADAEQHQALIDCVAYYVVRYSPDLTEGRGLQRAGLVAVNAVSMQQRLAQYACNKEFGPEYAFVQGHFAPTAMTKNWALTDACAEDIEKLSIVITVEEARAKVNIYQPGITSILSGKHWEQ